jgi:hypothetical protein
MYALYIGLGVAKGLLGVALKPAVGVFDLASRAAEGLRNTAYGGIDPLGNRALYNVTRSRIPRAFGRGGALHPYRSWSFFIFSWVEYFGYLLLGCSVISVSFIICMMTLLLMPLAGLHFCVGLNFMTPSL